MQTIVSPYSKGVETIYELLFCDRPDLFKANVKENSIYPWNVLLSHQPSMDKLLSIIKDESAESRMQLLAYHQIKINGYNITRKELLGVVIEVRLETGLDTLAAYKDGTARFINHSEKMIFWEAKTKDSNKMIHNLLAQSEEVVKRIGPWDKQRLPPPATGSIRLSFLVSDGLYFGQGPFDVLATDAMAAPVIDAATKLMTLLLEHHN